MRNNTIRGKIFKILMTEDPGNLGRYSIIVIDRLSPTGLREIRLDRNIKVLRDRLELGESIIPLHRVIEIRKDGAPIWVRRSALGTR